MTVPLLHLILTRPLAAIDLESTGVDVARDRVVEIAVVKFAPGGATDVFHRLVDPGVPIPAAATAVHGVADAAVAAAPAFAAIARDLCGFLDGSDLAGFGLAAFDLPLLAAEFARAGVRFAVAGRAVLDALGAYRRFEPRDLAHAVRFYAGRDHAGAHAALAAVEVLDRQVGYYSLPAEVAALHTALVEVDAAGRFRTDAAGRVAFGFGKHAGRRLADVARTDPGYLRWMLGPSFLDDVRALVRRALVRPGDEGVPPEA